MRERIIVAVVSVPALIGVLVFAPDWAAVVLTGLMSIISAYEFYTASGSKHKLLLIITLTASAIITIIAYKWGGKEKTQPHLVVYTLLLVFALFFMRTTWRAFKGGKKTKMPAAAYALFAGFVIPCAFSALIAMRIQPNGQYLVLLPFVSAFTTDGGAYFVGVFFGKRRAFPSISPKKTLEGCIGGAAAGVISLLIYGFVLRQLGFDPSIPALLACGVFGAAATEAGDLAFSLYKRERGIKDFGTLLPGHGGALDRFDSMAAAAPVIYALTAFLPVL